MNRESLRPYLWMLLSSVSFAIMATLARVLSEFCDWPIIALTRALLAFIFSAGLVLATGSRLVFWKPASLWIRSLAGSISLLCTFYAYSRLPVSDVLTVTNTFPIWVALLAWPVLNEPPTLQVWISIATGITGVVLIQQPHLKDGNFAALVLIGSSVCTAVAMLGLHRLQGVDSRAIVAHFSGVSVFFCIGSIFAFGSKDNAGWFDPGTLAMLAGVGVSATIGQIFLTKAFAAGPPSKVSIVGLSQVVIALLLDAIVFQKPLVPLSLLGMALVLAPTAWLMARGMTVGRPASLPVDEPPNPT